MEETIAKLNNIIKAVGMLRGSDVVALMEARERIENAAGEQPTEQDKAGLTRIDSILAIYSTIEEQPE